MDKWGTIYTREACPSCGKPFKSSKGDDPIECPACLTRPKRYYIKIWWQGAYRSLSFDKDGHEWTSWKRALAALLLIRANGREKFDPSAYHKGRSNSFSSAWSDFVDNYKDKDAAHGKLQGIGKKYLLPYFESYQMADIRAAHIEKFWKTMKAKGLSYKYLNDINQYIRAFFNNAWSLSLIEEPIRSFPKYEKIIKKPIVWRTMEEQNRVRDNFPERDRKILDFMILTGCRPGEAIGLQKEDTDWKQHRTYLRHTITRDGSLGETTKGKKYRPIPHFPELVEVLKPDKVVRLAKDKEEAGYQFLNEDGKHYSDDYLRDRLNEAFEKAGVERCEMKNFVRHSFGMRLAVMGFNKHEIAEVMGHSSVKITENYVDTWAEAMAPYYDRTGTKNNVKNILKR